MIIPAILENDFSEFEKKLKICEDFPNLEYVQVDVMDGKFVNNTSFENIEDLNNLKTNLKYELHLLVDNPLEEIEKWAEIKNVFQVVFHVEGAKADIPACINKLRGQCRNVGLAINPETKLEKVMPYLDQVDQILFLTVTPGRQGQPFQESVGEKIKEFSKIPNHPTVAIDGGVSEKNILQIKSWGVEIFDIGSALLKADDPKQEYLKLNKLISK